MTDEILKQDTNKTFTYNQIISKVNISLNCSDFSKLKLTIQNYITDRKHEAIVSSDKTVILDTADREEEVII